MHFLHVIFAIFFVIKLFFCAYIMSYIALVLKEQKLLFRSFLVRLAENFMGFYFLLMFLFFLDEKCK